MYVIDKEKHECKYSFTPGWFDEIEVETYGIAWDTRNVIECNSTTIRENFMDSGKDYYFWEGSLKQGERVNASVKYNLDVFDTNENEQFVDNRENSDSGSTLVIIIVVALLILCFIGMALSDYSSGGGFGGGSHVFISTCARSSCACARSCACACACAGGGRAGCNKKDFYTYLDVEKLKNL